MAHSVFRSDRFRMLSQPAVCFVAEYTDSCKLAQSMRKSFDDPVCLRVQVFLVILSLSAHPFVALVWFPRVSPAGPTSHKGEE